MIKKLIPLLLLAAVALPAHAVKVDLVCPCTVTAISESSVTIRAGAINRDSTTSGNITLSLAAHQGQTIFDGSFFQISSLSLNTTLAPGASVANAEFTAPLGNLPRDGSYFITLILDEGSNANEDLIRMQTAVDTTQDINSSTFNVSGIEVLEDDDNDGVSNFNELLEGTDPNNANSTPGASTIDAIFYYTPGAPAVAEGGITARLDQLLSVTNQIFSTSGTNVTIRNVLTQPISLSDSTSLSNVLTMMRQQQGDFSNLRSLKESTGADIAVVFLPLPENSSLCGLATLTGAGDEGDFLAGSNKNSANATVYIDCRDNVTAHEIGHVLGITHSRVEMRNENDLNGGTFVWSTGHGVTNSFVTVMANSNDFGGFDAAPEINVFSNPNLSSCNGLACGLSRLDEVNGADAVLSINTVRYQVARFTTAADANTDTDGDGTPDASDTDDDNDGVPDVADAFPTNPNEFVDTDGDGTGNNADTDDDNDGVPDSTDAFPLDNSETTDTDGDGVGDNSDANTAIRLDSSKEIALSVIGASLTSPAGADLTVPTTATAVSLNVTVVSPSGAGFITVYPCGVTRPLASNVNYVAGQVVPNGVVAPIGSNGKVCFFSSQETDIVVDVAGWFAGESFTGATPKRLVDSRDGTGTTGIAKLTSASPLAVQITNLSVTTAGGSSATIPTNISAAALNVTVTNPDAAGFVTAYPCDVDRPNASNVNYVAGQTVANGVIAPVSITGQVCLFSNVATDIIVDLAGWFGGSSFTGATPSRLVDTRDGTGGRSTPITSSDELRVPVRGVNLSVSGSTQAVPSSATAAALNVTVVSPASAGFVTVYPCGVSRPLASNLNFVAGDIVANNVIAPIGADGNVCLFSSGTTDMIVDIAGWFEGSSNDGFVGSTPKRLVDSRDGTGPAPR